MTYYHDTDDFLAHQTPEIRQLLQYVRQLILVAHPKMRERFMYNSVPFFMCYDYVCYFGKIQKTKGVEICFAKGFLLSNEQGLLDAKGRKLVSGITVRNLQEFKEIEEEFLEVLQEAILINETRPDKTFAKILFERRKK
ncbi:MAG: DUF1801 domain-containing protein [Spirosomataceae bacterium]